MVVAIVIGMGGGMWRAIVALHATAGGPMRQVAVFAAWLLGGMLIAPVIALCLGIAIDVVATHRRRN